MGSNREASFRFRLATITFEQSRTITTAADLSHSSTVPTAPEAAEMKIVSPALGFPMSLREAYAVRPIYAWLVMVVSKRGSWMSKNNMALRGGHGRTVLPGMPSTPTYDDRGSLVVLASGMILVVGRSGKTVYSSQPTKAWRMEPTGYFSFLLSMTSATPRASNGLPISKAGL